MREEISEPQHWRSRPSTHTSWSTRRPASAVPLPADLVDAVFTDEGPLTVSRLDAAEVAAKTYPELIASLNDQLAQLEAQRKQIQKLLAETNDHQS